MKNQPQPDTDILRGATLNIGMARIYAKMAYKKVSQLPVSDIADNLKVIIKQLKAVNKRIEKQRKSVPPAA